MFASNRYFIPLLFIGSACAADPGTRPQDMSAAQHQAAAQQEEASAEGHSAQHDPAATATESKCTGKVCWTSTVNPTAQHADDAKKHHELAAKHRAAGDALKQAEAQACAGIDEADRDISPFYHREDIASVSEAQETVTAGKGSSTRKSGARIVFRAVPGLTAEWLQREVDCHIARASALGHSMPEMGYCPLVMKDIKAKVSSTGDGFAVEVTSSDAKTVEEILKRAQSLKPAAAAPAPAPAASTK
jgi:hypothetical protein